MAVLESRLASWLKSALSVAGWLIVSVAALAGSSLAVSWIVTLFRDGTAHSDNALIGLSCSLIGILIVGTFHLRKTTVQLRVSDREKFRSRMQIILQDLGYQLLTITEKNWQTRPHFRALLFGAGIALKLDGSTAAITGPRLSLELIRRRYRMASHLDKVQESITDSKMRVAETYVKRLELSLRLEPKHMVDFQQRIVDVFAQNGMVLVDVQLMLISEEGMRESLWSNDMRPWLEENRIHYEYRRDHTQRSTLGAEGDQRVDSLIDTCIWS